MVPARRLDGCAQGISLRVRKAIQSIKEVVLDHSEADIYAALKECDMDPNDTAQKLLNQDPFHEVKRRRDKRKENTGYRGPSERSIQPESNIQRAKPYRSWDRYAWRGQTRKTMPGTNRKFQIVRDNRVNQKAFKDQDSSRDVKTESLQDSSSDTQQVKSNSTDKSSFRLLTGQKQPTSRISERHVVTQGLNRHSDPAIDHTKIAEYSGGHRTGLLNEKNMSLPKSSKQEAGDGWIISQTCSATSGSMNSLIGVYSSSSDPVHVPSPDSRSAGSVGAIGREIRAVGGWRQSSDHPLSQRSVSNSSLSTQQLGKDVASPKESSGHSKSASQSHQTPSLEPSICSIPIGKTLYSSRLQQPVANQKAMQPNMEWKPKTAQKLSVTCGGILGSSSLSSSSCPDNFASSNLVEVAGLSDKVSKVNISEEEHVIIPPHLQLPEAQRVHFTFGSFGVEFEPSKALSSSQASQNGEELHDESAVSVPTSVPVSSGENASADEQADRVDFGGRASPSESPESAIEPEKPQPGNDESSSPQNMDGYTDVSLVQSHNQPYNTSEPQLQIYPNAPSFSAYNAQTSYNLPFFRTSLEDNVRGQNFVSASEGFNSQAASNSPRSTVAMVQPQLVQQQHQPMSQMYPQVHIPHLPNFVPYRHVYSPVYAPPMAMPSYPSNTAYPHPSNASSYLMMPGGTSHVTTGAAKYGISQYKALPTGTLAGLGNFTNPAGYTITTPGTIGTTTNLNDAARMKYKDDNLYAPNPQAETPDRWIQTPRELPSLQSAPYYNLAAQAPQPAFLPAHAGHASFNTTAQTHVQYPGLYHPSQPASIANPHHLVHQQVPPGMSGTVGVGLAALAPQVGAYQPTQMGHLNWSANF